MAVVMFTVSLMAFQMIEEGTNPVQEAQAEIMPKGMSASEYGINLIIDTNPKFKDVFDKKITEWESNNLGKEAGIFLAFGLAGGIDIIDNLPVGTPELILNHEKGKTFFSYPMVDHSQARAVIINDGGVRQITNENKDDVLNGLMRADFALPFSTLKTEGGKLNGILNSLHDSLNDEELKKYREEFKKESYKWAETHPQKFKNIEGGFLVEDSGNQIPHPLEIAEIREMAYRTSLPEKYNEFLEKKGLTDVEIKETSSSLNEMVLIETKEVWASTYDEAEVTEAWLNLYQDTEMDQEKYNDLVITEYYKGTDVDAELTIIPLYPTLGDEVKVSLNFIDQETGKIRQHMEYDFEILIDKESVYKENRIHTAAGTSNIPITIKSMEPHVVKFNILGKGELPAGFPVTDYSQPQTLDIVIIPRN